MKNHFYIIIILSLSLTYKISAQQVITAASGNYIGANVQLSWTTGEPIIETFTGKNVILTQGFHQGKMIITNIEPIVCNGILLSVFPNPVTQELHLNITEKVNTNLVFHLFNAEGKLLVNKKIDNQTEKINMQKYPVGTYLLKVLTDEKKSLQSFKIIKI